MLLIQEKYINPLTDFGFNRIFANKAHKDLLIDFLNSLLEGEHVIESLEYKKSEQLGKTKADRKAIFDLYYITEKQEHIIIELQKVQQNFFKDRSIYYSTFPIQSQGKRGEWNYELMPVYTIGILNFIIEDKDSDKAIVKDVKLVDRNSNEVFYEKLHYIYLQMPNFTKTEEELETKFDKWLYTLKNLHKFQNRPNVLQGHIFERLFKIARVAMLSQRQLEAYEQSTKEHLDWVNCFNSAISKSRKQALKEGREQGLEEGLQQGLQEGLQKGLQEGLFRSAIKLLRKGQSLENISELIDVDLTIVEKLKQLLDKYADKAEEHISDIL